MSKVNLAAAFARFSDAWSPKIVGEVNDVHVKLVKLKGEFVWHRAAPYAQLCELDTLARQPRLPRLPRDPLAAHDTHKPRGFDRAGALVLRLLRDFSGQQDAEGVAHGL